LNHRALAQALVYQMQQALASSRDLTNSEASASSGEPAHLQRSPHFHNGAEESQDNGRLRLKRQHIVRREDGSILIINYEDFNQLISQPISALVSRSSGNSSSHHPDSGVESSQETSRSSQQSPRRPVASLMETMRRQQLF